MVWNTIKRALIEGALGALDLELRKWGRAIADVVGKKIHFSSKAQAELIERLVGSLKGFFGGLIEQNLSSTFWKVFIEKNIDLADLIASYVFDDQRGIDEWSLRRLARARELITDGKISKENLLVLEELLNDLYANLQRDIEQVRAETPRKEIDTEWRGRMENVRNGVDQKATKADRDIAKMMHTGADALASLMRSTYEVLWKLADRLGLSIERMLNLDFDPEQEAILGAREAEVVAVKRQAHLEELMDDADYMIARSERKRRRR